MHWRRRRDRARPAHAVDALVARRLAVAAALLAVGVFIALIGARGLLSRLDNLVYDVLLAARPEPATAPRITVVEIDDGSLQHEGQWPWPRHRVARLVDAIDAAGARVIGLDLLFAEPDRLSPARLKESLQADVPVGLEAVPPALLDNDVVLASSLSRARAVLGMWCGFSDGGRLVTDDLPIPPVAVVREKGAPAVPPLPVATELLPPTSVLAAGTTAVGFVNVLPDADGEVRRMPLLVRHGERILPALSLAVFREAIGSGQLAVRVSAAGVEEVRASGRGLPTDRQGSLLLPFGPGTAGSFTRVSALDLLQGRADPLSFRDRIVLVGASATAEGDTQPTPFDRRLPGVIVQAVAVRAMLDGEFIRKPAWGSALQALLVLVSVALPAVALMRGSLLFYAAGSALAAFAWWFGARALLVQGIYVSPVAALLALGSASALLGLVRFRAEERAAFVRARQLAAAQDSAITGLAAAAETRDPETGHHIIRTRAFVQALAEHLAADPDYRRQVSREDAEWIAKSAPLHDIGKVGVPDAVLLKPGRLDAAEFAVMQGHAAMGQRILQRAQGEAPDGASSSFLRLAGEMAGSHHERWDGAGYPGGLKGEQIPLSARLMAVADVYDALRSRRPYKAEMTHEAAAALIAAGNGTQFDPAIVRAFLAVEKTFADISRRYADERPGVTDASEGQAQPSPPRAGHVAGAGQGHRSSVRRCRVPSVFVPCCNNMPRRSRIQPAG